MEQTRRQALRKILLLSISGGGFAYFGLPGILGSLSKGARAAGIGQTTLDKNSSSIISSNTTIGVSGSTSSTLSAVKVLYVGMPPGVTGTNSEIVEVSPTSTLSDLEAELDRRHPGLSSMQTTMQILLNGMTPYGNPVLHDGDEVYYLAMSAGG